MSNSGIKIGCAFLNQLGRIDSGGLASVEGGEAFHFTGLDTLRARGDLWVVTSPESQFLVDNGLSHAYLRHSGFLPTPLTAIAEELGARSAIPTAEVVQRVSEVLARVLSMVDLMAPAAPSVLETGAQTLASHLQMAVAPALREDDIPAELREGLPSMFKGAPPIGTSAVGDIAVRIPANRLRLSQIVMSSAVPGGHWEEMDMSRYPSAAMALSYAIGNQLPVLCQVVLKASGSRSGGARQPSDAQDLSAGAVANAKSKLSAPLIRHMSAGAARWMALPEIIALSRIVDVAPKRIFIASELVPADASLVIPAPVFSPAAAASISAGLFAELYMQSVSQPAGLAHVGSSLPTPQTFSIRGAWLGSVARSYMLQEAMALADANFNVTSVGAAHLIVSISRRALRNLRKHVAASSLLSYPTGLKQLEELASPARETHMNQGAG
ncbi:hypothetical protein ABIC83_002652 [Roseateles asaccharophilus]|uniref:hypothetical protein n=1 Tax=Roseateles asaccharophilus TaxID=582607 RepID=UPI00383810BB